MDKIFTVICTLHLLLLPVQSRRLHHNHSNRNIMAFRDGSSYVSCCFVDIFCYATCFSGGGSLRAFVAAEEGGLFDTSETRRSHRHRHHHGASTFRTKRSVPDNVLWKKLRNKFMLTETNADENIEHNFGT